MTAPAHPVAVLLLAAGGARRFGALKQLEGLHGRSLVRRAAQNALATGLPVFVVTGAQAARVEAELRDLPVQVVHHPDWAQGLGSSLACGARVAGAWAGALIVMLADQPLVDPCDLHQLLAAHAREPQRIVAADHGDVLGPPCLFPAQDFPALYALHGDQGARAVLAREAARVRRVPMPHAALDVDTPQDLADAGARLAERGKDQDRGDDCAR